MKVTTGKITCHLKDEEREEPQYWGKEMGRRVGGGALEVSCHLVVCHTITTWVLPQGCYPRIHLLSHIHNHGPAFKQTNPDPPRALYLNQSGHGVCMMDVGNVRCTCVEVSWWVRRMACLRQSTRQVAIHSDLVTSPTVLRPIYIFPTKAQNMTMLA